MLLRLRFQTQLPFQLFPSCFATPWQMKAVDSFLVYAYTSNSQLISGHFYFRHSRLSVLDV